MYVTGPNYGPGEVSDSSSHGSKPPPSEPSVHGEGYSDFDSPSPGPPAERRRKRLREDSPDEGAAAAPARELDGSASDEALSPLPGPLRKMPKLDE